MAAVTVREWVNPNQAMAEAHGDFVKREGAIFNPSAGIIEEDAELRCDVPWLHADVARGRPELARPLPNLAEHPLVELAKERFFEHVAPAGECPGVGIVDPDLLDLIDLPPQRDVAGYQRVAFLRCERGCSILFGVDERIGHGRSQRRRGSPCISDATRRSRSAFMSRVSTAWFSSFIV